MAENTNSYTDPNFSLYQAYAYTLVLSLEQQSFGFAVLDNNRLMAAGKAIALSELSNPELLKELFASTFKKVIVGLPATALTLIPAKVYSNAHAADFARLLDVKTNEKVFVQTLGDENIIVYKTSDTLVKLIEKYNILNTVYNGSGWIKTIAKSSPPGNNLYIDISGEKAGYLYYFLGSLRYYNSFEFKDEAELVYYTLLVCSELNIKPQHTYLVMSGDIDTGDKYMSRLAEFYPNISVNPLRAVEISGDINPHRFLALNSLSLCGSSEEA